jgi:hypothetical protein
MSSNIRPFQTNNCDTEVFHLLALDSTGLEAADVVRMNLAVARGIPCLADLDIGRYCRIVDGWTEQFARWLPGMEREFHRAPSRFKDDIRFFRVGMLAVFLGLELGIDYIEEQKQVKGIRYNDPSDLFLNGLIDRQRGTCGSMPALHVAMSRRMGWPVSLACEKGHNFSRFDDGKVIYNVDPSRVQPGTFFEDSDDGFIRRYGLPRKAASCGSDLRSLSAREMLGLFLALRGRYFGDIEDHDRAETSYCLARALFPRHRTTYIACMYHTLVHGRWLFDSGELGHPQSLYETLAQTYAPPEVRPFRLAVSQPAYAPQVRIPVQDEIAAHADLKHAASAFSNSTIKQD